eukprot:gene11894-2449_t
MNACEEKKRRHQEALASHHNQNKILLCSFKSWKSFTSINRIKTGKQRLANSHHRRTLLSKMMFHMKVYIEQRRNINKEVERRHRTQNRILLSWTFNRWHKNVAECTEEKMKTELADDFASSRAKKKVFAAWREFVVHETYKRWVENCRVQEIKNILDMNVKRRALKAMFKHTKHSKRIQLLNNTARKFNEQKLKQKCLKALQQNASLEFKKMLLRRQSETFYIRNSLTSFFRCWKHQYKVAVQERNRTNVVLWWWSVKLQNKIMSAWKEFVEERKKKKIKEIEALRLRRENFMENCLQRWISYSVGMMAFRSKISNARGIEGAIKLQERVRRYAMMWYKKANSHERSKTKRSEAINVPDHHEILESPSVFERKNMILTLPVLTKEMRPLPRKPDYLRDSFDLGQFLDSSGNGEPVEALSKFTDESNPRQPPPQPASPNVPCLQRKGDSILLAISSEEDSQRKRGSKIKKPAHASQGCSITQALLPPSSFKKTLDDNRTGIQYRNPKRGAVVSDGIHTNELSETEERILDTGQQYQGSSTEESSSESGDSGQEESSKCPENEEIYKEVTRMRDILRDYQKQQKRLRSFAAASSSSFAAATYSSFAAATYSYFAVATSSSFAAATSSYFAAATSSSFAAATYSSFAAATYSSFAAATYSSFAAATSSSFAAATSSSFAAATYSSFAAATYSSFAAATYSSFAAATSSSFAAATSSSFAAATSSSFAAATYSSFAAATYSSFAAVSSSSFAAATYSSFAAATYSSFAAATSSLSAAAYYSSFAAATYSSFATATSSSSAAATYSSFAAASSSSFAAASSSSFAAATYSSFAAASSAAFCCCNLTSSFLPATCETLLLLQPPAFLQLHLTALLLLQPTALLLLYPPALLLLHPPALLLLNPSALLLQQPTALLLLHPPALLLLQPTALLLLQPPTLLLLQPPAFLQLHLTALLLLQPTALLLLYPPALLLLHPPALLLLQPTALVLLYLPALLLLQPPALLLLQPTALLLLHPPALLLLELEERQSHILQWINLEIELHKDGTFEGDDDFLQATQLNVEILSDIQKVTEHISERKPMVKKLAKDIQVLLQKLNV